MKTFFALGWLLAILFMLSPLSFAVESDVDRLLDLLVEKKVLTKDDAATFRAELAVKKQDEKEQQKEFMVVASKPLKLSGYTQVRFRALEEPGKKDSFDIRRARLDLRGEITERFDYRLQVEFAGSSPKLLDAIAAYKPFSYLRLQIGQFKIPFSQENLISSNKLETINRSQVVEALVARGTDVIGNQNGRDIGAQASGTLIFRNDRYLFDYAIGVFNGAGINASDNNEVKDVVGRIVLHPLKGLDIGGSVYRGEGNWKLTPTAKATNQDRDRWGLECAYAYKLLTLKGEYIAGEDGEIDKEGWYLQAGYYAIPNILQGVFKYDTYDPNTDMRDNESDIYTFGVNWYFNKYAFLQLNYELTDEHSKPIAWNAFLAQLTLQF